MKKNKRDRINRRKFVGHVATGTMLAFGMGVMVPRASAVNWTVSGGVSHTESGGGETTTESGQISASGSTN